MPRYRRYFAPNQTVFLTLVTATRAPWLRDDHAKHVVLDALRVARTYHPFRHFAHVLLPDHLHLLLAPAAATTVPGLVGSFKRAALAALPALRLSMAGRVWQPRYYDHIVRDADDFARHLDYIHFNPVKHGLVTHASRYRWSSLAVWQERGIYPLDWGSSEPAAIRRMSET